MARIKTIARRTFLIGSTAIVGGAAFGVYQINRDAPNPLVAGEGEATLNPFVLITKDGVTLITPRAEMGQGVQTTLAALAAEELDVAWEDITVLHGPPAQAYYNSVFLGFARIRRLNMVCASRLAKSASCWTCRELVDPHR